MRPALKTLAAVLLAAALPAAAAMLPLRIPFQGKLLDPATNDPKNGPVTMQFRLYLAPVGGAALFSETQTVTVVNGFFQVQIGTVALLSPDLFSGASAYLGVTVGADAEILPRQPLSMGAYAFTAMQLVDHGAVRINSGVAYTTFTTAGNWEFPYGVTAGSAAVTGNAFSVGGSSFVVGGGSATVAYRAQAGSFLTAASATASGFFGDGSGLTGVPVLPAAGGTMTGQLTSVSSITIRASGPDQFSLQTSSGIYVASGTFLANGGGGIVSRYGVVAATGTFMIVTSTGVGTFGVITSSGISMAAGSLVLAAASSGLDAAGTGIAATTATFMTLTSTGVGTFGVIASSGISMLEGTLTLDGSSQGIDATGTGVKAGSAAIVDNAFSVGASSFVVGGGSATVRYRLSAGSLLTGSSATASGFFGSGAGLTGLTIVLTTGDTMTGQLTTASSITIRASGPDQYSLQTSSGIYVASGTFLVNGGGGVISRFGIAAATGTFSVVTSTGVGDYGLIVSSGISMTRGTFLLGPASRGLDASGTGITATTGTFMTVTSTGVGTFGVITSSGISMLAGTLKLAEASSGVDATGTGVSATTATFMVLTSTGVGTFGVVASSGISMNGGTLFLDPASRGINAIGAGITASTGVFTSSLTAKQFFGIGASTLAVRTVILSRTSTVALAPDTTLAVPLAANQTYSVYGVLFASSASATPDLKIAFTVPSGAAMNIGYRGNAGSTTTFTSGMLRVSGVENNPHIPVGAVILNPIFINGTVVNGANAGFLQLQWAQNTSNATAMSLTIGSYIGAKRIQ